MLFGISDRLFNQYSYCCETLGNVAIHPIFFVLSSLFLSVTAWRDDSPNLINIKHLKFNSRWWKKSFFGLVWKIWLGDIDSGSDKTRLLVSSLRFFYKIKSLRHFNFLFFFPLIFINCTLTWQASSTCVWFSSGVDHPVFFSNQSLLFWTSDSD